MIKVSSECCEFLVGRIVDAEAYCYVCGTVHQHGHLDLRSLKKTLLGRVVSRHNLNWDEIAKDTRKFGGMQRGIFCQSVMTEIEALCQHRKTVFCGDRPLRLHMCFGADDRRPGDDRDETNISDLSVQQGLDFTSDLCAAIVSSDSKSTAGHHSQLVHEVEARSSLFSVGQILKYNPDRVVFELA